MKQTSIRPLIATVSLALALTACGGAPKKVESLEEARSAYTRASSDATIARHAPSELDQAHDALVNAEHAWKEDEQRSRVDHYAYLASQRIRIAELISQGKEADKELANMRLERQRVQLDLRSDELDRRQREAEELRRQMNEMQARNTERGIVLTLGDVLFDTNEADLTSGAMDNIDRIADFMKSYPERIAIVEGHTDNMGEADYNMDLSSDRAFAVRQALAKKGISTSRITTRGFGMDKPVASNQTSAGRQENRRVEIIFPDSPTQISELSD